MKAVFSISKISHQNQRLLWPTAGYHLVPKSKRTCGPPTLIHLAVVRTLATLRPRRTHYEILDLSTSATAKEIRQAFIKLSKQCHPDTNRNPNNGPNNHKTFVQVNEAYSVLSKLASRRDYDASLAAATHTSSSTARSYGFGPHSEPKHYTQYKGYPDETDWTRYRAERPSGNVFTNFYTLTACITCAVVGLILHYMQNYFPDSRLKRLRNHLRSNEMEQHDFIMTSQHEGMTVYYYAVPKPNDPESYEVLAVKRSQVKDSDMHEMQELNSVEYTKNSTLH